MRALAAKNHGVIIEKIRVTPEMKKLAFRRIKRTQACNTKVIWEWWRISQSEFHRREVGVVDLGDVSDHKL